MKVASRLEEVIEVAIAWSAPYGKYEFAINEVECRDKDVGDRSKMSKGE
jgi:hypothetical protein